MMFALLGRMFGTDKAISSIVKSVSSGLDALVYTDEEKAGDAAKERTEARQMVVQWMQATQGQNLARRLIALSITGVWLMMYVSSVFMSLFSVFFDASEKKLAQAAEITRDSASDMSASVMLILAFYFSAPYMGKIVSGVFDKMKKQK